ncbi:MAG: uroporphyrinogen decarboxylase [Microthrixaceae bacterium]
MSTSPDTASPAAPGPFLQAALGGCPDRVPVWFMRQAGRALPEYRAVRGDGSIIDAIADVERATEITLQPVRRYGVDAAVLYSDIVTPAHAIGVGVDVVPGVGPVVERPFRSRADLARLRPLDPEADTPYVLETIRNVVGATDVPLIGFAGAPFTVASYLIEGRPSRTYGATKALMLTDEALWFDLLEALADLALASIRSQVAAGAKAVQLFDSWAGALTPAHYRRYVLPTSRRVFAELADLGVPRVHFGVGTGELLGLLAEAGPDMVGVDWRVPLSEARRRVGGLPVQGNLDPAVVLGGVEPTLAEAAAVLGEAGPGGAHVFNLGHGVLPETDPEVLEALVEFVHSEGRAIAEAGS